MKVFKKVLILSLLGLSLGSSVAFGECGQSTDATVKPDVSEGTTTTVKPMGNSGGATAPAPKAP